MDLVTMTLVLWGVYVLQGVHRNWPVFARCRRTRRRIARWGVGRTRLLYSSVGLLSLTLGVARLWTGG